VSLVLAGTKRFSLLSQSRDFGINVALKFKFRLGEFGHGLHLVDLLTASLLVTQRLVPGLEAAFLLPARMFSDVGKRFSESHNTDIFRTLAILHSRDWAKGNSTGESFLRKLPYSPARGRARFFLRARSTPISKTET
jgi:hypothetical protein